MKIAVALMTVFLSSTAFAATDEIPLNEKGFVEAVQRLNTASLHEMLGAPVRTIEVKDEISGDIIGQIWHFEYLNTSEAGEYYKGTELDIIDDRVVTVVFTNSEMDTSIADADSIDCPQTC